jgi:hypothetical protein
MVNGLSGTPSARKSGWPFPVKETSTAFVARRNRLRVLELAGQIAFDPG